MTTNVLLNEPLFKLYLLGGTTWQLLATSEFQQINKHVNIKNMKLNNSQKLKKKAEKERQKFKQKYGVNLPAYNQQGDKIAQNEEPDCITRLRLAQTNQPKTQTMHKDNSRAVLKTKLNS